MGGWAARAIWVRGELEENVIVGTVTLSQAAHSREVMLVCGSTSASLITADMSLPLLVMLLSPRLRAQVSDPVTAKIKQKGI